MTKYTKLAFKNDIGNTVEEA